MTSKSVRRRILIVDDQQEIHDTCDRIFAAERSEDVMLADFESRFLEEGSNDPEPAAQISKKPQYELDHVHSGEQAVHVLQASLKSATAYAVAFVDMRMPNGMDGVETTEKLWEIDPSLHVVICTAYSDHIWDDVLVRLGYNDQLLLLKKPFESDEARQLALALSEKQLLSSIQEKKFQDLGREVKRYRNAEETMRTLAHRDALTNLPNRPYLLEKLSKILKRRNEKNGSLLDAVLFLDLDNFKIINDSLGHDAGDELLNRVASRLQECVREHDSTSRVSDEEGKTVRLGGDEFVVLLEQLPDPHDATRIANRIVSRISEPYDLADRLVTVGTSIGVAYINEHVNDAHEAIRNADTAMYRAKNAGKGEVAVFDQAMRDDIVARIEMENQLRRAVNDEGFILNYQPIVNLKRGTIQGVEVLIRWKSDAGQTVSPSQFVPILEEIGLIGQVGEWVLEKSMRDITKLLETIPEGLDKDIYLGVNVSLRQLSDPFFLERLEAILQRTGFDRKRLKLEMNETSDLRYQERALATMLDLHTSGVAIQIDDFGKGQSSLTCFQVYPIEAVKIDRSFMASIATEHTHAVIAQAIVQLAHHLSARIVAEGVESEKQLDALREWGCDAAQGYLFSPPLTCESLETLLRDPMQSEGIRMLRTRLQPAPITFPGILPSHPINFS